MARENRYESTKEKGENEKRKLDGEKLGGGINRNDIFLDANVRGVSLRVG